ncbi:hypothetical protein GW17_00042543 [Ensete ventricosum]|nr:hypothetical protein GW17_00042543 [Ensete ventricosum]
MGPGLRLLLPINPSPIEMSVIHVKCFKIERMIVLPITVKAVVELELLEIIVKAGPGAKPSPADVVSRMPTENPEAVAMVDRILCLLAAHGIVSCSVVIGNDGHPSCKYGTAPVCKYLTKNEDDVSLAPLSLSNHNQISIEGW